MAEKPVILIVDDEPFNLDYLEQELEDLGVEICTAADGQEALAQAAECLPDMIFLDIMMPVMDGFEVLRRLKANPTWKDIPVVIISAASDMSSVVKGIELGADDFLPKPFNPVLLHARLKAGLEKKRLRDLEMRYLRSLERELEIGREIQADFLPKTLPQPDGWRIEAYFCPAREVSGDFYDVFVLDASHVVFMLGDVTDKGVGSALFMALIRSLLRAVIASDQLTGNLNRENNPTPQLRLQQALNLVNSYIDTVHESSMLATIFLGVFNVQSGEMYYLNAGHDPPYHLRNNSILSSIKPSGPLVGAFEGAQFQIETLQLETGDRLVIYSDGILDALNPSGEMFSKNRWQALLSQPITQDESLCQFLASQVTAFIGEASQYDDITLLTIIRKGTPD